MAVNLSDILLCNCVPKLDTHIQCIVRLVCQDLSGRPPQKIGRFTRARQLRKSKLNANENVEVYKWHISNVSHFHECDSLLSEYLKEHHYGLWRLSKKRNRLDLSEDDTYENIDAEWNMLVCEVIRCDNATVLRWMEERGQMHRLKLLHEETRVNCVRVIAKLGDAEKLMTWLTNLGMYDENDNQRAYVNWHEITKILEVYLKTEACLEDKLKVIYKFDTGCPCECNKMFNKRAVTWEPAMGSGDLDLIKELNKIQCGDESHHPQNIMGCEKRILAHNKVTMKWMIQNAIICPKQYFHVKEAAAKGRLDLLMHMTRLRRLNPTWFPMCVGDISTALWHGHVDCAEYLISVGCHVNERTMSLAIRYGRLSIVKQLETRGMPLRLLYDENDHIEGKYDRERQDDYIEIFEYMIKKGYKLENHAQYLFTELNFEKVCVYLHKTGRTEFVLGPNLLSRWRQFDCRFNEYIDKHAGLTFLWGPYVTGKNIVEHIGRPMN